MIDKDRSAELLAQDLGADALLMLTDVDAVYRNWVQPDQTAIRKAVLGELDPGDFPAGSMRPKVEAASALLERRAGTVFSDPDAE